MAPTLNPKPQTPNPGSRWAASGKRFRTRARRRRCERSAAITIAALRRKRVAQLPLKRRPTSPNLERDAAPRRGLRKRSTGRTRAGARWGHGNIESRTAFPKHKNLGNALGDGTGAAASWVRHMRPLGLPLHFDAKKKNGHATRSPGHTVRRARPTLTGLRGRHPSPPRTQRTPRRASHWGIRVPQWDDPVGRPPQRRARAQSWGNGAWILLQRGAGALWRARPSSSPRPPERHCPTGTLTLLERCPAPNV